MAIPGRSALSRLDKKSSDLRSTVLPGLVPHGRAFGHIVLLSGAQAVSQLSTFGVMVLVARVLAPADFGRFSVALATITLLSQLPGAGLDLGAMRLSALQTNRDDGMGRSVLGMAGLIKVVSALVICILVLLASLSIDGSGGWSWAWALRAGAIGALAATGGSWVVSTLQSRECHGQAAAVLLASSVFRIAPVIVLICVSLLSLRSAILAYVFGLLVGAIGMLAPGIRPVLAARVWQKGVISYILGYSKWTVAANVFGVLLISSDLYLLSILRTPAEVGIYSAARSLAMGIAVVSTSAMVVLLPRAGLIRHTGELRKFVVGSETLMILMLVPVVIMYILAPFVMHLFYGNPYVNAVSIFRILLVAYSMELPITPILVYLLVRNRPDVVALINFAGLTVAVVGYFAVAPSHGAIGAAFVYLATRLLMALLCALLGLRVPGKALNALEEAQAGV